LVFSSLVFGVALAKPIVEGVGNIYGIIRALVYRDVEGRHYAYDGKSIDVVEDSGKSRWLRVSDVRSILPHLPKDETLCALLGPGVSTIGSPALRVRAEVLHEYLAKATTSDSLKFRLWIGRTIVFPSSRARADLSDSSR